MATSTAFIEKHYGSLVALQNFCAQLPKVELHAHINGSISPKTRKVLYELKKKVNPDLVEYEINRLNKMSDFFELFKFIYQLTDDKESVSILTRDVIKEFYELDNVRYLELRSTPRACQETGLTKEIYVKTVLDSINELSSPTNALVKLILAVDRRNTLTEAFETVDLAIKYKDEGVVGVDLCGDPEKGSFEALKPALLKAQQAGLKLTLHFGEVDSNVPENASLLSVHPDRLGHATKLDEASRAHILQNKIPVEICMTSNILLKTVTDYSEHHVKELLYHGSPFILCTDDKGVFGASLTEEYMTAASTFNMLPEELYTASLRAIEFIFADESTKAHLRTIWAEWWKSYSN